MLRSREYTNCWLFKELKGTSLCTRAPGDTFDIFWGVYWFYFGIDIDMLRLEGKFWVDEIFGLLCKLIGVRSVSYKNINVRATLRSVSLLDDINKPDFESI